MEKSLLYGNLTDNLANLNQVTAFGQVQGKSLIVTVNADGSDFCTCQIEDLHHFAIGTNDVNITAIDAE